MAARVFSSEFFSNMASDNDLGQYLSCLVEAEAYSSAVVACGCKWAVWSYNLAVWLTANHPPFPFKQLRSCPAPPWWIWHWSRRSRRCWSTADRWCKPYATAPLRPCAHALISISARRSDVDRSPLQQSLKPSHSWRTQSQFLGRSSLIQSGDVSR